MSAIAITMRMTRMGTPASTGLNIITALAGCLMLQMLVSLSFREAVPRSLPPSPFLRQSHEYTI